MICLLSALRFHGLTTQPPFEVWLAIDNKTATPKLDYPPLRINRFSGAALTEGIEEHIVNGVTIRITDIAKTVADCFKYRNKIGLDVTLEVLREAWNTKRMTSDEIWHYAKIDRVSNVMPPQWVAITTTSGTLAQGGVRPDCVPRCGYIYGLITTHPTN